MTNPEALEPLDPVEPEDPLDTRDPAADLDGEPGSAEPRRYPSTIGGACYLAVLVGAITAVGIVVGGDWRVGVRVLAGCLAGAGVFRLVLPLRDAGMLAVRHRLVDVVMLVGAAALLWWLAGSIPDQPV